MLEKTAIITGASGALAAEVIKTFTREGWKLALIAHRDSSCQRLRDTWTDAYIVQADLSDDTQAQQAVDDAATRLGKIGALLNIAGGFDMAAVVETSPAQLQTQLNINFLTTFHTTRAVLPYLLKQQQGFILGTGAGQAVSGGAMCGAYAASKAAMIVWLQSVRAELVSKGIDVGVVYPMGTIDTPANREAMPEVDPASWIQAEEIAATVFHLATRSSGGRLHEARIYPPEV